MPIGGFQSVFGLMIHVLDALRWPHEAIRGAIEFRVGLCGLKRLGCRGSHSVAADRRPDASRSRAVALASTASASGPTGETPCRWHCAQGAAVRSALTADARIARVTEKIFEMPLGISNPGFIAGMNFEAQQRKLSIQAEFELGSRFAVPPQNGVASDT